MREPVRASSQGKVAAGVVGSRHFTMASPHHTLVRIGSRDSQLALKQTDMARDALQKVHPHLQFEIVSMKTKGDKILDVALSKIGSKSLFTKELEFALEEKTVDIVVHSLKDLPTTLPEGMVIGAVLQREDPRDAVIMHPKYAECTLATLPKGSVIGTSSLRRSAQLKRRFPDLVFKSVRGNLNTRFRKLDDADDYAALVLAAAGVVRMGWKNRISQYLSSDLCMYAVGQGALAVECREGDSAILDMLSKITDPNTMVEAVAERAFMRTLEGGCSAPVAVHTKVTENSVTLKGGVWSLDGSEEILHTMSLPSQAPDTSSDSIQPPTKVAKTSITFCGIVPLSEHKYFMTRAHQLGISLARALLDKGAEKILKAAKAQNVTNLPPNVSSTLNGSLGAEEAVSANGS